MPFDGEACHRRELSRNLREHLEINTFDTAKVQVSVRSQTKVVTFNLNKAGLLEIPPVKTRLYVDETNQTKRLSAASSRYAKRARRRASQRVVSRNISNSPLASSESLKTLDFRAVGAPSARARLPIGWRGALRLDFEPQEPPYLSAC